MSNSIWKTPDQKLDTDKKEFSSFPRQVVACHISSYGIEWGVAPVCLYSPTVKIEKWCYLDDLIAQADKAERLQKAVNTALISLGTAAILDGEDAKKYADAKINLIKQLMKGE